MGSYMNNTMFKNLYANTFVFDLEYIGYTTELEKCYIWEIGIVHLATQETFSVTIDPGIRPLPKPFSKEFCEVTPKLLQSKLAVSFKRAWELLMNWVSRFHVPALWISHNCFKSDKIVLEAEIKRHNLKMPLNWYFFDSLIFCRFIRPKLESYTLSDLYNYVCYQPMQNAHSALDDAISLMQVLYQLNIFTLEGPIYPSHCTSLQVVKWLGPSCEKVLFENDIRSLEQLKVILINEFTMHCLNTNLILHDYIRLKLTSFGIKPGNATSITASLIERWI